MLDQDQALHSIRLFLEDAEPSARELLQDPAGPQGPELRRTADRLAADLLNALVILRVLQPSARGFNTQRPKGLGEWRPRGI